MGTGACQVFTQQSLIRTLQHALLHACCASPVFSSFRHPSLRHAALCERRRSAAISPLQPLASKLRWPVGLQEDACGEPEPGSLQSHGTPNISSPGLFSGLVGLLLKDASPRGAAEWHTASARSLERSPSMDHNGFCQTSAVPSRGRVPEPSPELPWLHGFPQGRLGLQISHRTLGRNGGFPEPLNFVCLFLTLSFQRRIYRISPYLERRLPAVSQVLPGHFAGRGC